MNILRLFPTLRTENKRILGCRVFCFSFLPRASFLCTPPEEPPGSFQSIRSLKWCVGNAGTPQRRALPHARRALLPCALENRARPGRVAEHGWLCGTAPPLPTRASEPPRPSAPPTPGRLAARSDPLTCGLPAPCARLYVPRCAQVEGAAGCATSPRPHLPRGATPRPGPAPTGPAAPLPGQPGLQPALLPSAAARQGSRQPPGSHRVATCVSPVLPD